MNISEVKQKMRKHDMLTSKRASYLCDLALEDQKQINENLYEYISRQDQSPIDMSKMSVLVLGHKKSNSAIIKPQPYLQFINLNEINAGKYSDNEWAEGRGFLSQKNLFADDIEYYGFVTASWPQKYAHAKIDQIHNWFSTQVLFNSKPEDGVFLSADMKCSCFWYGLPITHFLKDLLIEVNLPKEMNHRLVPTSNQGIFHKSIFHEFKKFLEENEVIEKIAWFLDEHDTRNVIFAEDCSRIPAYLVECINMIWLSHQDYKFISNASQRTDWRS